MSHRWNWVFAVGMVGLCLPFSVRGAHVEKDLQRKASWTQPTPDEARARVNQWLASLQASEDLRQKVDHAWQAAAAENGAEVLDVTVIKKSGNPTYDAAIERGIRSASPLPVPPATSELFPQFRELNLNIRHER